MLSITSRTYSFVLRQKDTAEHCQGAFRSISNWSLLILSKQDFILPHKKTGCSAGEGKLLCSWNMQRAGSVLLLLHLLHLNLLVHCSLPLDLYWGSIAILPLVALRACIEASCSRAQQYIRFFLAPRKVHYRNAFLPACMNTYLQLPPMELIQIYISRITDWICFIVFKFLWLLSCCIT